VQNPAATLVIVTKDRKEELGRALDSCLRQVADFEILVIDDGSSDGTEAFVRANYPDVRVVRSKESRGLIVRRNEGARVASGEILISIDDDAEFSSADTLQSILGEFSDPSIAAVAIPFVDVQRNNHVKQKAPASGIWITNQFIGTAYAIRKEAFLAVGGFRDFLFHQEEEGDLCIRLLERGYYVRLSNAAPIFHYESPRRSLERINIYGQRNLMLFAWYNVPFPEFFVHLVGTIWNGLIWGARHRSFAYRLRGTFRGFAAIAHQLTTRSPVSRHTYWRYRRLKKRGPIPLSSLTGK
jgi:GT2 family glycosyltransferase